MDSPHDTFEPEDDVIKNPPENGDLVSAGPSASKRQWTDRSWVPEPWGPSSVFSVNQVSARIGEERD